MLDDFSPFSAGLRLSMNRLPRVSLSVDIVNLVAGKFARSILPANIYPTFHSNTRCRSNYGAVVVYIPRWATVIVCYTPHQIPHCSFKLGSSIMIKSTIALVSLFGLFTLVVLFGITSHIHSPPPPPPSRMETLQKSGKSESPAKSPPEKKSFSIAVATAASESSVSERGFDGVRALRNAYLKRGIPVPNHLKRTAKRKRTKRTFAAGGIRGSSNSYGSEKENEMGVTGNVIALSSEDGRLYLAPIEIGGRIMRMNVGTGSSDL